MDNHSHNRGQWGSTFGFLMAAVGSAVGLGNIWGFPYKMGANGGFAFLLIYFALGVLVGFPIMISELAMGRKIGRSVIVTYRTLDKRFTWVGWLAMLSPFLILAFYSVLGAYCMEYIWLNFRNLIGMVNLSNLNGNTIFDNMRTDQPTALFFTLLFLLLCFLIIKGGIKDGIERFNTVGMPALFIMLTIVIIRAVTLEGAVEGLKFVFVPNFQPLKENFIGVLSAATPGAVRSGMEAVINALERIGFSVENSIPYLAHTVSSCGSFLSKEAGVPKGSALAYLIAPPLESMIGLDAALKASDVKLCKLYAPPTETNFGGGLLTGTQSACAAACEAFKHAVAKIAGMPIEG